MISGSNGKTASLSGYFVRSILEERLRKEVDDETDQEL